MITWSNASLADWTKGPRPRRVAAHKQEQFAQSIARQIINGTLPSDGVLACESNEAAQALLGRIKYWVELLEKP